MKLYRLTVTLEHEALVWAKDEVDARKYEDDVSYDSYALPFTTTFAVDPANLSADELDEIPYGAPGDWTSRQLLAGEHEAPMPGPPESLAPETIGAWLALPAHRGNGLRLAGIIECTDATLGYVTDGHGLFATPADHPLADLEPSKKPEAITRYITARTDAACGRIAWADLDRVCREHEPSDAKTLVQIGPAMVDVEILRQWVWGAAAVGAEDVTVEWAGAFDHVRVCGSTWTAAVMPVRADRSDGFTLAEMPIA